METSSVRDACQCMNNVRIHVVNVVFRFQGWVDNYNGPTGLLAAVSIFRKQNKKFVNQLCSYSGFFFILLNKYENLCRIVELPKY